MFATNSSCSAFHCGTLPFPAEASARESAGGFFGTSLGRHVVAVSASSSFSTSFSFDATRWETEGIVFGLSSLSSTNCTASVPSSRAFVELKVLRVFVLVRSQIAMCLSIRFDAKERVHMGHGACRVTSTVSRKNGTAAGWRRNTANAHHSRRAVGNRLGNHRTARRNYARIRSSQLPRRRALGLLQRNRQVAVAIDRQIGRQARRLLHVPRSCSAHRRTSGSGHPRTSGSGHPTSDRLTKLDAFLANPSLARRLPSPRLFEKKLMPSTKRQRHARRLHMRETMLGGRVGTTLRAGTTVVKMI